MHIDDVKGSDCLIFCYVLFLCVYNLRFKDSEHNFVAEGNFWKYFIVFFEKKYITLFK